MAVTVSKVAAAFKEYVDNHNGKARFKFAITSSTKTLVSKCSFAYASNLTQLLSDYAAGKNGQTIIDYRFESGVPYKINGTKFAKNYIEVVVKVSDIVAFNNDTKFAKFLNEQSRECHDRNSRDKHVLEIARSMTDEVPVNEEEGDGEDA